jgi:hypothetical protein
MTNETRRNPGRGGDTRRAREHLRRQAETRAAIVLRLTGYRILDRRVRTPAGAIDIVVRRDAVVAFVEVKARQTRARPRNPFPGPSAAASFGPRPIMLRPTRAWSC